jgi:hypothetical protein
LSANDAVFWLLEQQDLGYLKFDRIVMASRRGQLRKARGKVGEHRLQYIIQENAETQVRAHGSIAIDWLIPRFCEEIEAAYGGRSLNWQDIWNPRTVDTQKHLADSVKEATEQPNLPWRSVMMALSSVREYIFLHLEAEDKIRFFKTFCTLFFSYQAPMPIVSAQHLLRAMKRGMLKVEAGVSDIARSGTDDRKYCLTFLTGEDGRSLLMHGLEGNGLPSGANKHQLEVDYLIEAVGQTRDIQHFQNPYPPLFEANLLQAHQWAGIRVDPESLQPIKGNGERWENVYHLGINNQGGVLICTNAPNNIRDGERIGLRMISRWVEQQNSRRGRPAM